MRESAAEKAKTALLEDIAVANAYAETLKQKIEKAKNRSSAKDAQEKEAATEEADPQGAIREDDEEPSPDETEDTTDPTVEEDTPLTKWR